MVTESRTQSRALEVIASAEAGHAALKFPEAGLWSDGESHSLQKAWLATIRNLTETRHYLSWPEFKEGFDGHVPGLKNEAELHVKGAYEAASEYFELLSAQQTALEGIQSANNDYDAIKFPGDGTWSDGESVTLQKAWIGKIQDLTAREDLEGWKEWKQGFDKVFPADTKNKAELQVKRAYNAASQYFALLQTAESKVAN